MTRYRDLHDAWMSDPAYAGEYEALEEEFSLGRALTRARMAAGLSRDDLAARVKTRASVIARLEDGASLPSGRTLKRIARATGTCLKISFETRPDQQAAQGDQGRSA